MSTATEHTWDLFRASALSDDDLGYPNTVAFVATDIEGWEGIAWRHLRNEGVSTVVVDEDATETMLVPVRRASLLRWVDRARGRVAVQIQRRGPDLDKAARPIKLARADLSRLPASPGDPSSRLVDT